MECINDALKLLQAKQTDLVKAANLLENVISAQGYRGLFDQAKSTTLATKWVSGTQFETTRARKIKQHFHELKDSLAQKATFRSTFVLPVSILYDSNFLKYSPVYLELQKYLRQFIPTHC